MALTLALVVAAIGLGSVHSVAPDHWVPFAALARAERWSRGRTVFVTGLCGLGHVTVSVALGLASAWFGLGILETFGRRLESAAGVLLIAFGTLYAAWGVHRSVRAGWHGHVPAHGHVHVHHHPHGHVHTHDRAGTMTVGTLFLLFCADPCVAVIPLMFGAAPLGWASTLVVVAAYEAATIGTMVALVLPAAAVARSVKVAWADRYADVVAGSIIAGIGIAVVSLGL